MSIFTYGELKSESEADALVSLVVLFYNHRTFVDDAVRSALEQDYSNCEIILSDDCSTDGTQERILELVKDYHGPHRVVVNLNEKNLGVGAHLAAVHSLCHGKWIVTQGGDDLSEPNRVSVTMAYAGIHPDTAAIGVGAMAIDESGREIGPSCIVDKVKTYPRFCHGPFTLALHPGDDVSLVMITGAMAAYRRDVWELAPIPTDIVAEDVFLSHRAILLGEVAFLPGHFVRQRVNAKSISRNGRKSVSRSVRKAARRRISRMSYLSFNALYRELDLYRFSVPAGYRVAICREMNTLLLHCFEKGSVSRETAAIYIDALRQSRKSLGRLIRDAFARGCLRELIKLICFRIISLIRTVYPIMWGGVGNQLFVYAAARAHALRTRSSLVANIDEFEDDTVYHRTNRLSLFDVKLSFDHIHSRLYRSFFRWRDKKLRHCLYFGRVEKPSDGINKFPLHWFGKLWLRGYWQSESYFSDYNEVIERDLQVTTDLPCFDHLAASKILADQNATFVHVRSFHDIPGFSGDHMENNYYRQAILHLIEKTQAKPHLFLFSDKPEYARARIEPIAQECGLEMTVVDSVGNDAEICDLELMRMCRHGILANSSFSWWAAWRAERNNLHLRRDGCFVHQSGEPFANANKYFWPERWTSIDV